jgi:hypothetical protein
MITVPPCERTYQTLLEVLFDTLERVASSLGLQSPAHTDELLPRGDKYYNDGIIPIYVYTVLKKEDKTINVNRVYQVLEDRLIRSKAVERMNIIGSGNYNGSLHGPITLIDVQDTPLYCRIELAVTDEIAIKIKGRRRERRMSRSGSSSGSTTDNEY